MFLTLEITSPQAAKFGSQRLHTFGIEGGRIGRAADNEWVIPDQYVHSIHAVVRFMSGLFFIEKRGQNRVSVNRPDVDLPINEPFPLRDGDRLYIDEYELTVRVSRVAPTVERVAAPPPQQVPLDPITGSRRPARTGSILDDLDSQNLDPLDNYQSLSPKTRAPSPQSSVLTHGSVLSDHYRAPTINDPPQPGGGNFIPDDWERTSMTRFGQTPKAAPAPQSAGPPPSYSPPLQNYQAPPYVAPVPAAPAMPERPAAPIAGNLAGLAEALGLRSNELSAADVEVLGRALRNSLSGLIELLQVRNEIRSRFRVALTLGGKADPNPLKSAPNVEDALHELFRRRQPGALAVDQAIADGMEEARLHQLAILDAMRGAFDALIARLDPAAMAAQSETTGKRNPLAIAGRSRHWENYLEYFGEQMGHDREEAFRRLFGSEFAGAYEQSLDRLRRMTRNRRTR
jgi:type VI secretion system protein ImpI